MRAQNHVYQGNSEVEREVVLKRQALRSTVLAANYHRSLYWGMRRLQMAGRAKWWENRCGAKTRKGTSCLRRPVPGKKRCLNHGGLSTGPRTPEGKARTLMALRAGWLAWREKQEKGQILTPTPGP